MKGLFYRKFCTVAIVILFVGISIAPSISGSIGELSTASLIEEVSDISSKLKKTNENDIAIYDESAVFGTRLFDAGNSFSKTIYVDDDNTEGPWDGTQEHPYQNIQSAIDDANNGDTVFVYSGTYYENVVVDKSIELTGEDRNTTIIDGSGTGYVIYVTADTVTVNGFTIQNSGIGSERAGICIINNNILISNNIISNNEDGIRLIDSEYTEISSNILNNNQDDDIVIRDYSNNNIVTGNKIISYNEAGIILYISNRDNIIFNNTITNHDYGIIICYSSNFNTVYNNVITKNNLGIYIHDSSDTNKIYHNNLMENTQNAYDECTNTWDNEEKGNYWDDYEERYPDAHKKWLKGIWDTPYEIPAGDNQDRYPLIKPYSKSKPYITPLFPQFLEQHPHLFPLLRQLMGLQ